MGRDLLNHVSDWALGLLLIAGVIVVALADRLTTLYRTVQRYSPTTESQSAFYQSATDQLETITTDRQQRVEAAETSIPGPLLALMIIMGLVTLATTVLIKTHSKRSRPCVPGQRRGDRGRGHVHRRDPRMPILWVDRC